MNANFDSSLQKVLLFEGGFVDDPTDHGGATNKGITQREYDAYRAKKGLPLQSVKFMSDEEMKDIYFTNYWLVGRCDVLPNRVDFLHFDTGILHGVGRAAIFLQHVVGVKEDGVIGAVTLQAVANYDPAVFVKQYVKTRIDFDIDITVVDIKKKIAEGNPFTFDQLQLKYLRGWADRAIYFV